ncbi:MAG: methionyl-tRNA formyltransferase [Alphaproteobacteria bacterium 16-39-46]|nr:MAG: methionyl-tRNA formyltransferase [Alphaproteobacteria bacterium 16-39-46]OZA43576.1 MAG: methionyl-tRNA formyltransferase [Alphaproteobacteria bacterium 17-39-52]HQS83771.1 methionyl-tRNA formyltransferase [Alphaproteobacteria bacterium]HQS93519.1 methionyl-tRNA formyltransferase [Alphaproteobacteria bacterium]
MMTLSDLPMIFMGTPSFSEKILAFLLEKKCLIAAVYTNPPKAQGRGHDVTPSPVHVLALKHDIPVFTPSSLRLPQTQAQFLTLVQTHHVKVVLVVAYGFILPKILLEAPPLGCLNVHASLLPRWRGASPIQRAIEAGDLQTGLTLMKMTEGLDEGPILLEQQIPITPQETSETLFEKLSEMGGPLVLKGLSGLLEGTLFSKNQAQNGITYAPKVLKEEGLLDFEASAVTLERKVRAFTPWPGTFFNFKGLKIKVIEACTEETDFQGRTGEVIHTSPFKIRCGNKTVFMPLKLQRPGGTILNAADFLRGFPIDQGALLKDTSDASV